MRYIVTFTAICFLFAGFALAADIDGKWVMESVTKSKKQEGKEMRLKTTLDLKAEGGKLTGTVTNEVNGRSRDVSVQDGKIDGNKFSFTTTQKMQQAEVKVKWEGSLEGGELRGERAVEGRPRPMKFNFKRP